MEFAYFAIGGSNCKRFNYKRLGSEWVGIYQAFNFPNFFLILLFCEKQQERERYRAEF